jgi:hypothetical protein
MGPVQSYLVRYNGYQLPGYAQSEDDEAPMEIVPYKAPYHDGGISEYTGMPNKNVAMKFKIWEPTWQECKDQYFLSTTYLRSKRAGRAPLYIGYTDRHYDALTAHISRASQAGNSPRLLEYDVTWEVLPWLERDAQFTISGSSATTINTDAIGRTITTNGGWSPTTLMITGTNVTISGYTDMDSYAGFISVSGTVTNLLVDTYNYTATIGGVNANSRMLWKDYGLWVGPGKSYFTIGGSGLTINISWHDRWY